MRLVLILTGLLLAAPVIEIRPAAETESLAADVDDPSLWVNPSDASRSLIVATVKMPAPDGALAVFTLDGRLVEEVAGIDRPNNVDIQGDICVVTERYKRQLRIYRVSNTEPHLRLIGTVQVFEDEDGERGAPMGIGLYERPADRALFAIVSRKTGPVLNYLWQYRLQLRGDSISGEKVREFGAFSGSGEIEAVAVDDAAGIVYYADEDCCLRSYRADPDAIDAPVELNRFAASGFRGNREGIAVTGNSVIVSDQLAERSEYHVFDSHTLEETAIWRGTAESTDGIEAFGQSLGNLFPRGILIAMNNSRHNFHLYRWPEK